MPHFNEQQMSVLQSERTNDPLVRGYSGMTSQQIVDDINTAYRTRNRSTATGREVKDQIVASEFNALTDGQQQIVLAMCARDDLDPFGLDADIVADIFPATTTLSNLSAWRVESISRAEELGLPEVFIGDVDRTV